MRSELCLTLTPKSNKGDYRMTINESIAQAKEFLEKDEKETKAGIIEPVKKEEKVLEPVNDEVHVAAVDGLKKNAEAAKKVVEDSSITKNAEELMKKQDKELHESKDVRTRLELAKLISEARQKKQTYKISKSLKEGFRYNFEITGTKEPLAEEVAEIKTVPTIDGGEILDISDGNPEESKAEEIKVEEKPAEIEEKKSEKVECPLCDFLKHRFAIKPSHETDGVIDEVTFGLLKDPGEKTEKEKVLVLPVNEEDVNLLSPFFIVEEEHIEEPKEEKEEEVSEIDEVDDKIEDVEDLGEDEIEVKGGEKIIPDDDFDFDELSDEEHHDDIEEDLDEHKKCVICGAEIEGYGNNAEPVKHGVCCDECNQTVVIPARLEKMKHKPIEEDVDDDIDDEVEMDMDELPEEEVFMSEEEPIDADDEFFDDSEDEPETVENTEDEEHVESKWAHFEPSEEAAPFWNAVKKAGKLDDLEFFLDEFDIFTDEELAEYLADEGNRDFLFVALNLNGDDSEDADEEPEPLDYDDLEDKEEKPESKEEKED